MSMAMFALPKAPLMYVFFGFLIFIIFILPMFARPARKKARSAAFQSMGFLEVPREQAFESYEAASRVIEDTPSSRILSPVGKGSSALGDTIIFNYSASAGGSGAIPVFTVVGFRVPPSIPDFEIHHTLLGDRFFKPSAPASPGVMRVRAGIKLGPSGITPEVLGPAESRIAIEGNPEFSKNYVVKTSDEAAIRRMLTSGPMDALAALNDSNLNIKKGKDWLFVYRYGANPKSPKEYPTLLEEAVGLVSRFDLKAANAGA
jgi:hypothetical protein